MNVFAPIRLLRPIQGPSWTTGIAKKYYCYEWNMGQAYADLAWFETHKHTEMTSKQDDLGLILG